MRRTSYDRRIQNLAGSGILLAAAAFPVFSQAPGQPASAPRANWELANKFGTEPLRRVTYSTAVQPRWMGKSDSLWYNWKDHNGSTFLLVVPPLKVKRPLFDHAKLAAALAVAHHKPYDPNALPFTTLNLTKDHKKLRFTVD